MHVKALLVGMAIAVGGAGGPASAQTMANLKTCQNFKGDPDQQIRACSIFLQTRRAVGGRPAPALALAAIAGLRGGARARRGETDLAIEDYNLGLSIYPANHIYILRGLAYYVKGDYRRALDDYNKGIPLNKGAAKSEALNNRGLLYMSLRDYDHALADLNEAIRVNPKNGHAFSIRGQIFAIRGDRAKAETDYRTAANLNPKMKAKFEHFEQLNEAWLAYLKEIQDEGDFANWSSPPLESFQHTQILP